MIDKQKGQQRAFEFKYEIGAVPWDSFFDKKKLYKTFQLK